MGKAKVRRMFVKAVEYLPCTKGLMEAAIKKTWKKLNKNKRAEEASILPNWTSVARWKKKYLANGKDAFALVDANHNKGNRNERYETEVREIVSDCIDQIYMQRERKPSKRRSKSPLSWSPVKTNSDHNLSNCRYQLEG